MTQVKAVGICLLFMVCAAGLFVCSYRAGGAVCFSKGEVAVFAGAAAAGFALCAWLLLQNQFVYHWDYGGYWVASYEGMQWLFTNPTAMLQDVYRSILQSDYNLILPVLVSLPLRLFGYSFVQYVLINYICFLVPVWFVMLAILKKLVKKLDLQQKQLRDTQKKDQCKLYGELLMTYGYSAEPGSKSLSCTNYYTGEEVTIPLDETLSATENAKRYYERYTKLKRTAEQLTLHLAHSTEELGHLASIRESLAYASCEADLAAIRRELTDFGYLKYHKPSSGAAQKERKTVKSAPLHFRTSDGYDIYVGKNNYQNDELTFRFANGGDWWFHAKGVPGSHVILKAGSDEPPVPVFEAAASLAAFYSANRQADKVEVDYIERKHVKKPAGAKPGFVLYHTNYSMMARPSCEGLTEVVEN